MERNVSRAHSARPSAKLWSTVLIGLLTASLVGLGLLMHFAAGPPGVALDVVAAPPPDAPLPRVTVAPARRGSPPEHLVLLVDDEVLAASLRARVATGDIVESEHGSLVASLTFEVLVVRTPDQLMAVKLGLAEYDPQCATAPCSSVRLIDLRSLHPAGLGSAPRSDPTR